MSDQNKSVVRRLFEELWNKGNLSLADQLLTPNYTHHDSSSPDFGHGPEGERRRVTLYRNAFPDLRLTADLSHYVVGREFAWPIAPENHAMIHRVLDNSWGLHGRVASREQIQVQLGFPQHRDWVDLFMGWWEYGIRSWRQRAGPDATLTFLCELGPPTYAMTDADGYELSDRWQEALAMRDMIRALWRRIELEDR